MLTLLTGTTAPTSLNLDASWYELQIHFEEYSGNPIRIPLVLTGVTTRVSFVGGPDIEVTELASSVELVARRLVGYEEKTLTWVVPLREFYDKLLPTYQSTDVNAPDPYRYLSEGWE